MIFLTTNQSKLWSFECAETHLSTVINQRTALPLGTLVAQLAHKLTTITYAECSLSH